MDGPETAMRPICDVMGTTSGNSTDVLPLVTLPNDLGSVLAIAKQASQIT